MTTPESRTVEQRLRDLLHELDIGCNEQMPEIFGDGGHSEDAAAILAAAKEHGLVIGEGELDRARLAEALHNTAPLAHRERKCRDRHDLRAADIAAEYERLRESRR